tara:strand:- start:662 stop:1579 length:918 start_codon:yes stop_codon:yes gene_type:complete
LGPVSPVQINRGQDEVKERRVEINKAVLFNEVTIVKLSVLLSLVVLCFAGGLAWYSALPAPALFESGPGHSPHSVRVAASGVKIANAEKAGKLYEVRKVENFEVTGSGGAAAWEKAKWAELKKEGKDGHTYFSRFKMVYSSTGLYFFFSGSDEWLSATMKKDFMDLFLEDVFEVFLWPDESQPLYFEYEISPLNRELPLLVTNISNRIMGWLPWHYSGDRKVQKKTGVIGNRKEPGAVIKGWSAEFFIPFKLLEPLLSSLPKAGDRWRANFYRVDYDGGKTTKWEWSPVAGDFHRPRDFGTIVFR